MSDTLKNDLEPLMDPSELAGDANAAINAEFAARDAIDAIEAAKAERPEKSDDLPLDGE